MPKVSASSLVLTLAAGWISGIAVANQSLVLFPGQTATVSIPSVTPFTTLGSSRLEFRLNRRVTPATNARIFDHPGFTVLLAPNGEICAVTYFDSMPDYGNIMCA